MERLVDRYLRDDTLALVPLHSNQHAYQAGKSVETSLHQLVVQVEKALDQQEIALGAFLDIEDAFNNTCYDTICDALVRHGSLALSRHHSTDYLLCILNMVAWLSNGQCQEKAKQDTETGMLRDNRSDSHNSHWCYGGARWPPSAGSSDTGGGKVSGASPLELGVLVLPSPSTRTQLHIDSISEV
jgi:hypothetical protein